jgi:hypothetical protein
VRNKATVAAGQPDSAVGLPAFSKEVPSYECSRKWNRPSDGGNHLSRTRRRPRCQRTEIRKRIPAPPASVDWRPTRARSRVFPGCPGTTTIDGGTQLVSRFMIRVMVQQRKLIGSINYHFPHPRATFAAKRLLQTKWLLELVSVFGRFLGCKILPNFTKFYQFLPKTSSERPRTGVQKGGFRERFI